ncbi:MAG: bifunctional diguanylate cyclase/phosphodiesterase [Ilumatobacteraceae bacterium]
MTEAKPDTETIDVEERSGAARRRSGRAHSERDVALFSVALVAISALLFLTLPDAGQPTRTTATGLFIVVLVGFALSEYSVFRFVFRRESIAFSLSEVPMAFALVFLAPGPAFLARAISSLTVIFIVRRPPLHKFMFNLAAIAFELALAYVVFRGIIGQWGSDDTQLVVAVIIATGVCGIVSSMLVSFAISRVEGDFLGRISSQLRLAWWLFLVNATLAGMVLSLALVSPYLVLLAAVPVALLWYVIKAFGAIDQRLRDLDAVHGFTGRVGQSLDPDEIGRAAVSEAARLLRAEGAAMVLFDHGYGVMRQSSGVVGVALPIVATDPHWASYISSGSVHLVTGRQLDALRTAGSPLREILVASIDDQTGPIGLVVVSGRNEEGKRFDENDITRLQNLTEQLAASLRKGILHQHIEREARQDGLTGLPNRLAFERAIVEAAADDDGAGDLFVLMVDLDRFKEVNDTLGHNAGDDLLREVARRIQRQLRPDDVVARLAGDEFAIVARRRDRDAMLDVAWACVREIGLPVTLDGLEIVVTASAGLAAVDDADDAATPLRYADIAMFNAKSQRLGVEVYRDEIDRRTPARLSMLGDLRSAIEEEHLHVNLQPKLDLSSGLVIGAEALVRWTHAVRGTVSPTQFVRVAEDTGLIKQLTDLMLDQGISSLRTIHDRGYHLGLAVNLSTHDLLDTKLAERVEDHLRRNGVDPAMLTLEITESSLLIDAPRARATINELHEVGVRLSIDDFGTGYSSLSYLRRLPVGELKIDQSFVANLLIDEQDEVIVRSTIDLGHNLGLVVVAEGVENNEVLERLREFGCDVAQGYCISRPLPPEQLMSWLATTSHPSQKEDPLDFTRWVDIEPADDANDPSADPGADRFTLD